MTPDSPLVSLSPLSKHDLVLILNDLMWGLLSNHHPLTLLLSVPRRSLLSYVSCADTRRRRVPTLPTILCRRVIGGPADALERMVVHLTDA